MNNYIQATREIREKIKSIKESDTLDSLFKAVAIKKLEKEIFEKKALYDKFIFNRKNMYTKNK